MYFTKRQQYSLGKNTGSFFKVPVAGMDMACGTYERGKPKTLFYGIIEGRGHGRPRKRLLQDVDEDMRNIRPGRRYSEELRLIVREGGHPEV